MRLSVMIKSYVYRCILENCIIDNRSRYHRSFKVQYVKVTECHVGKAKSDILIDKSSGTSISDVAYCQHSWRLSD